MTTLQQLLRVFERVFEDEVDLSAVRPESELIADLGMSSIAMLYMAMELEGEFGIKFTNEDFSTLRTVEDVTRKIEGK
ncbi:MAG: acyl carrier protein [Oscillospiraceae bacterium]|nr:acyl carrier protein [Oscillospiraceae bacterium]